jgi:hypothetical protein
VGRHPVWELVFLMVVLKIPIVYLCWVVWWAIKAEPVPGAEGEAAHEPINWRPWHRPEGPRPRRGGPHGPREPVRVARRRERAES